MLVHALSATELLAALQAGDLTSVEIVCALVARCEAIDDQLNCFTLRRHEEALSEAEAADKARAAGQKLGPLHGLPLTIKDNLDMAGTDATLGITARVGQPARVDAPLVATLRAAGAIVLAKTNIPQLLLAQETENPVFGLTRNPWHGGRSAGGSSGGEAAAIAAGLSPCGFGTDIGGSIRIPAHFCGIAGLKPTVDRLPNRGSNGASPGQEIVRAQVGPMARTVADLQLLMSVFDPAALSVLDPAVPPLPLGDPGVVGLKGKRIGWFDDDGFLTPSAPLRRAVGIARDGLLEAGAILVDYRPPAADELIYLWLAAVSADGARTMRDKLAGEPISRQLAPSLRIVNLPGMVRKGLSGLLKSRGEHRISRLLQVLGEKPVQRFWQLAEARTAMRRQESDLWRDAGLDAVLCPAHVVPAMGHGESGDFTLSASIPFRYTYLNFPAGVVPVTRVGAQEATLITDKGDRIEKKVAAVTAAGVGLPLGVQVIARPYREDVALAVMAAIEGHARALPDFPATPIDPMAGD